MNVIIVVTIVIIIVIIIVITPCIVAFINFKKCFIIIQFKKSELIIEVENELTIS